MITKTHYSCAELAQMKLPGLPASERRMHDRVKKEKWESRTVVGKGGKGGMRTEYKPPKAIMELIFRATLSQQLKESHHEQTGSADEIAGAGRGDEARQSRQAAPGHDVTSPQGNTALPARTTPTRALVGPVTAGRIIAPREQHVAHHAGRNQLRANNLPAAEGEQSNKINFALNEKQRLIDGAIRAVVNWVRSSGLAVNDAIDLLNKSHAAGQLHADIAWALENCHAKSREDQQLNRSTYFKWLKRIEERGTAAPKKRETDLSIPDWGVLVLKYYRRPQKPSLSQAIQFARNEWQGDAFSNAQCYRLMDKIKQYAPEVLYRGRNQGAALKALLPYIRRNTENLWANDVWTGDGHSFKAKFAHPDHGRPFTPEVTLIVDVASRKVLGWSISYSENVIAVCDALRHAVSRHGLPLIYYSDNGSGQTARQLDAPITGMLGQLGIHHETGRPNSPQGRGLIERIWQTLTIPLAKQFPTFAGKSADRDTLRRTTLEIEKSLRKGNPSKKLPSVEVLKQAMEQAIEWYNSQHKHSAVGSTPNDAYAARAREEDIVMLNETDLIDLFRPQEERVARRGIVSLWNNIYYHRDLMLVDGQRVLVGYDIHDPQFVVIRRLNGEFVCQAEWNANEKDYMPISLREKKRMERADGRIKRAERIISEAQAELTPALEHQATNELPPMRIEPTEQPAGQLHIEDQFDSTNIEPLPTKGADRPWFTTDAHKYRWLMEHQSYWTINDIKWLFDFIQTEYYEALEERFANEGMAWGEGDTNFALYKLQKLEEGAAAQ